MNLNFKNSNELEAGITSLQSILNFKITKDANITVIPKKSADEGTLCVTLKNGEKYDAELVGSDSRTDIAVIKIDAKNLVEAKLGNSDNLVVGQTAIAIGNNRNLSHNIQFSPLQGQ